MRKIVLLTLAIVGCVWVSAQQSPAADSLKEYTGKYKFPEGSGVDIVTISIQNGALYGSSSGGSSELKRVDKDVFEIVAYSGIATFKRNESGKINGLKLEINGGVMDGDKTEDGILIQKMAER